MEKYAQASGDTPAGAAMHLSAAPAHRAAGTRPDALPGVRPGMLGSSAFYSAFHANFEVVVADTPRLVAEAMALRYQVYCLERGFEDPGRNPHGCERDEFDHRSVHALVRHSGTGDCVGAVRLVLADADNPRAVFPLEVHCSDSFYPGVHERIQAIPRRHIAEISRFAVSKQFRRRLTECFHAQGLAPGVVYRDDGWDWVALQRRIMPYAIMGLFAGVTRLSRLHGVTHWLAAMETELLRLLRQFGIRFPVVGPPVEYHGRRRPTLAVASEIADEVYTRRYDVWELVTAKGLDQLSDSGAGPQPRPQRTGPGSVPARSDLASANTR